MVAINYKYNILNNSKEHYMKKIVLLAMLVHLPIITPSLKPIQHASISSKASVFVLGCDVTVSKTTIGVFEVKNQQPVLIVTYTAPTQEIPNIYTHIKNVLADVAKSGIKNITAACFAAPGGIQQKKLFLHPHLPWSTSEIPADANDTSKRGLKKELLETETGLKQVSLVNDFQAAAIGIQALPESEIITLQPGNTKLQATKLIVGAGNGLGAALLLWNGQLKKYCPQTLNYSFTEYGAQSELESKYFNYLKANTGNIAWGKVLGAAGGIVPMYNFLDQMYAYKRDAFENYQFSDYVQIFAKRKKSLRCQDAVDFYMAQYVRFVRNIIYAQAPHAGVYITNTVAQEFPELFDTSSGFIEKVTNLTGIVPEEGSRNYLQNYLKEIPVYLISNKQVQLYGAALLCLEPSLITT